MATREWTTEERARMERRFPWTKYERRPSCGPECLQFTFRLCWIVPDSTPGLYGWRDEIRLFRPDEEAIARAAAEAPMGIARTVRLDALDWDGGKLQVRELYSRKNAAHAKRRERA